MERIKIERKTENDNLFYFLNGEEIARSFPRPKDKILNPKKLPEYQVIFRLESETVYGLFAGRNVIDAIGGYLDFIIGQYYCNRGIYCQIVDIH